MSSDEEIAEYERPILKKSYGAHRILNTELPLWEAIMLVSRINSTHIYSSEENNPAAAAPLAGELAKEAGKAVVSKVVEWILGEGLDAAKEASTKEPSEWRDCGDEQVMDDGPGGGYIFDGVAPEFGAITVNFLRCCDDASPPCKEKRSKAICTEISIELTDSSGDWLETHSGLKKLEVQIYRKDSSAKVKNTQFGCKTWTKEDVAQDKWITEKFSNCIPCDYLDNHNEITLEITAKDWYGNTRKKRITPSVDPGLVNKCCK